MENRWLVKHHKTRNRSAGSERRGAVVPSTTGKKAGGQPTVGAFVTKGKNPENFRIRCVYCEEPHYSASCEKVVSSEDRKTILRNSNRCYNCLRKGHLASACANTKKCRNCSGKHHQSICSNNLNSKIPQKQTQEEKNANETKTDGESSCHFNKSRER